MASAETGPVRVLGVDTSLRSTGVAVVEARGNSFKAVEYGVIRTPAGRPVSECLGRLHQGIVEILRRSSPAIAAVEGGFYCKNARTAMVLGEARGVVIAVCSLAGIPVYEYPPRRVKQAVVGYGAAEKDQVSRMVVSLLGLARAPEEDAGDALAIALCHLHNRSAHELLRPKAI